MFDQQIDIIRAAHQRPGDKYLGVVEPAEHAQRPRRAEPCIETVGVGCMDQHPAGQRIFPILAYNGRPGALRNELDIPRIALQPSRGDGLGLLGPPRLPQRPCAVLITFDPRGRAFAYQAPAPHRLVPILLRAGDPRMLHQEVGCRGNRAKAVCASASASSKRPSSHNTWTAQTYPSARSGDWSRSAPHSRSASSLSRRLIAAQASCASSSGFTNGYSIMPSTASVPARRARHPRPEQPCPR
jgi:hypothetical protein